MRDALAVALRWLPLLAVALVSGCGGASAAGTFHPGTPHTLTVVTQPFPTAGFWEGTAERPTGGLELAMAQDLARRLGGRTLVVRTLPFSRIVAGELGGADLAMALITPTDERSKILDFTTPYIHAAPALVTRAGVDVPDVQTAQGLRWAVEANTTFEGIVDDVIRPDEPPLIIEGRSEELDAVSRGRADVAMFDLPAAEAIVRSRPELAVAAKLARTEPIAVALPKDSPNTEAVGSALRAMEADGTIDRLSERWLGVSLSESESEVPLLRTDQR